MNIDRDPVVRAQELRKTFSGRRGKSVRAVRGVSLEVDRGQVFGFLGPNGAGKTTTLRMLTTLLPIDEGSAVVAGADVRTEPARVREHIGYVSQLGGADELATGRENLVLQARLYGIDATRAAARAGELCALFDLSSFADRKVQTYSGGQRRRLDVALGIVHEPDVLFLDEPGTGLDPQNRANLWDQLRMLRDRGTTVFLTTHYLEEADALCDRLVIIDHGEIVADGAPQELKREVSGDLVELAISGEGAGIEAALALLESQPFVREASVEGSLLRLYVEDGTAATPALLRLLDERGIGLQTLRLGQPTLDDVFLRQTGRSLRDAGGPDAAAAPVQAAEPGAAR